MTNHAVTVEKGTLLCLLEETNDEEVVIQEIEEWKESRNIANTV